MKRRKLMQHLHRYGCTMIREGASHTIVLNPSNNQQSVVPRHPEIDKYTTRDICKQLDIPAPRGA